jgi:RNA polymerase sigma-70 factor, ECF subfamily
VETTSASLLLRLRQPADEPAWRRFVDLYTPLLFFWTRRLGLPESDAADLVQDIFTTLVQKLPEFHYDAGKSFRAWLRTLVENRWRDRLRRLAARPKHVGETPLDEVAVPDDAQAVWEAEYRRHLFGRALQIMQSEFEPATWKVCLALIVDGKSGVEVAAEMGMKVEAVYQARARVLRRLRQELAGLLD